MAHNIKKNLSKKLKELRKKHKLTQEQLADKANIDYKYLQKIEGKNPPSTGIDIIEKLAIALETTPAKLLEDK